MQNPDLFAKNNSSTAYHAQKYLDQYKDFFQWNDPEDVLDIGCANGRITREVLFPFVESHLGHLLGADISKSSIDMGNKMYKLPNLHFEQMNIEDTEVSDKYQEKFGHIFAFLLFQMVHRDDLWSKNVYKMLKNNGQLFATIVVNPCIYSKVLDSLKADKTLPWQKYIENQPDLFVDYGPNPIETISNILRNAEFAIDSIEVRANQFIFPELRHMTNTFLGIEPYSKYIPAELRDSYNEEFVRRCMKYTKFNEGKYSYSFDVLSVLATKK